jgi:SM-20-related protein
MSTASFELSDQQVSALGAGRVVLRDQLLGRAPALTVCDELRAFESALAPAAMGADPTRRVDLSERGDEITWLERDAAGPGLTRLWDFFEAIGAALRQSAYLDVRGFEVQLARYRRPSSRYARHRDALRGRNRRRVTAIYYANPHWRPEHGGQLRVHEPGRDPTDVAPLLDRLVLFLSERVEHEVLPCHAERSAVTAWFFGADVFTAGRR